MKKNIWNFMQSLGKSFMYPIALLSVCGMMLGLGAGLTDANVMETFPFLKWPWLHLTLTFIVEVGAFAFVNLPVIFAMAIPLGMLKDKEAKAYGTFSAFVGFMAMHLGTNFYLSHNNLLADPSMMATSGQASILGIQTYNTSVLGGIIAGLIVYSLYGKVVKLRIPESLGFYSGVRLVPIISLLVMSVVGLIIPFIWPPIYEAFMTMGRWISSSSPIGYFSYAAAERITIPFGLNHLVTSTFRFTPIGGSAIIGGQEYHGTLNMFMAYVQQNEVIPVDLAGKMEQGKLMIQYGLAGAACAIYACAHPKNKKMIKGLIISGILTVIIGGVSEPIEFLFLFISPLLFVFHIIMNGLAGMILPFLGVRMGFTGDLVQFLTFGVLRGTRTGWPIAIVVMVIYFFIYYFVFKWAIEKFNIKTPGREYIEKNEDEEAVKTTPGIIDNESNIGNKMVRALGGMENIQSLDNCVTRLRVVVNDMSLVNEEALKANGAIGIVILDDHTLQVIIGTKVYNVRRQMDIVLGLAND